MADSDQVPPCTRPLHRAAALASPLLSLSLLSLLSLEACGGGKGDDTGTTDGTGDGTTAAASEATAATETAGETTASPTTGAELPAGCDAYVVPGEDDQATLQGALIDAAEGSTVCMGEGTFVFESEVTISVNGLTLQGAGRDATILDFSGQNLGSNGIKISGDGVTVKGFTVRDTPADGIRGDEVQGITFDDVVVEWPDEASTENGAYGFYPVGCDDVVIRNSKVIGARDAGIYVGQSTNIIVEDNEAYGNVAGIEIENSTGATVRRNNAHDNTAGILIFNLPGLPVQDGKRTLAYENTVENNNVPNFGEAGTVVSKVPPGIGFMILASDSNEIRDNTIRNNDSAGVVIVSYSEALFEAHMDPEFDEYAESNYVHHNMFENNGSAPDPLIGGVAGTPVPDVIDDGCKDPDDDPNDPALVNCMFENDGADWVDFGLCNEFMKITDIMTVTCEHPALPEEPA